MREQVQATASINEDSANLRTVKACSRVTPGNHSRNYSTVAPPSRFSNRARTGTRVPVNTHAPLTLPGTRSTAEHFVQSNMRQTLPRKTGGSKREAATSLSVRAFGMETEDAAAAFVGTVEDGLRETAVPLPHCDGYRLSTSG